MCTENVTGAQLAYTREGAGQPLLCLHGGMGIDSASLRVPGITALASRGCDLVIFDQRGHGESSATTSTECTHEAWAMDAFNLARHLGWNKFALLGHSYGGFIALEYAVRWPHTLSHLILVATSAGPVRFAPAACSTDEELRRHFEEIWPAFFSKSYALAVDTMGKLRWSSGDLEGDHLICVVSERVPTEYFAMLRKRVSPMLFQAKAWSTLFRR